jgi:gliding motility-associated-like protein
MDSCGLSLLKRIFPVLIFLGTSAFFLKGEAFLPNNFHIHPSCQVDTSIQVTICEGLIFSLNAIEYDSAGIYEQHLIAANGCDSIITLELLLFPDPPIEADFDFMPTSCEGAQDGYISVLSVSGTRPPFDFLINDSIVPAPNTLVYLPAGTYEVAIQNEYGCFDKETIIIEDGPALNIQLPDDIVIPLGHSITLEASANLPLWSSMWNPTDSLQCPNCISTLATPSHDQTYVFTGTTEEGCTDFDSITVRVDPKPKLFIPNVFSPNHDGINDLFQINADPLSVTSFDRVYIFDRWGGILNQSSHLFNEGIVILWDGSTDNGPVNPGMYVYLILLTLANGDQSSFSGDVTVIR